MANHMIASYSSNPIRCAKCKSDIAPQTLRIRSHFFLTYQKDFHLRCFVPYEPKPLTFDKDIEVFGISESDRLDLKAFVEGWNRQFEVDEKVIEKYVMKGVETASTAFQRLILEVCCYLKVSEIELSVALVAKGWLHASRNDEVWRAKYTHQFQHYSPLPEAEYRRKFITAYKQSCWCCGVPVAISDIKLMCPLHNRPLCVRCGQSVDGTVISISAFCKSMKVAPGLPAALGFPSFEYMGVKSTYIGACSALMSGHAASRRRALVDCLRSQYSQQLSERTVLWVEACDLLREYQRPGSGKEKSVIALLEYCGKSDRSDTDTSVKEFVKKMRRVEKHRPWLFRITA